MIRQSVVCPLAFGPDILNGPFLLPGLAVRWAYYSFMYVGLVYLNFIHMTLQRF
jgi:hypothetical protein